LTRILQKGAKIEGSGKQVKLIFKGETVMQAESEENMLVIRDERDGHALAVKQEKSVVIWHARFGHAGFDGFAEMAKKELVTGLTASADSFKKSKEGDCTSCLKGKMVRQPFPRSERECVEPLELIHMDLCGPMQVKSKGGKRFILTFTDDCRASAKVDALQSSFSHRRARPRRA
jgi:hypothetical protein